MRARQGVGHGADVIAGCLRRRACPQVWRTLAAPSSRFTRSSSRSSTSRSVSALRQPPEPGRTPRAKRRAMPPSSARRLSPPMTAGQQCTVVCPSADGSASPGWICLKHHISPVPRHGCGGTATPKAPASGLHRCRSDDTRQAGRAVRSSYVARHRNPARTKPAVSDRGGSRGVISRRIEAWVRDVPAGRRSRRRGARMGVLPLPRCYPEPIRGPVVIR